MRECPTCFRCYSDDVSQCPAEGKATINSLPGGTSLDGRYELERRLGQGGMGVVYRAHHILLKSSHAIKVILPELVGNDPSLATRFRQEAMAAAAIRHPNIISVTDYGIIGENMPFLVMECVEGDSLQDVMSAEGQFSGEQALEYMRVIASGVGAAHNHGIVHRDLKPLNIMIQRHRTLRDGIRILDFGLAKIKSGELLGSFVGAKTTGIIGSPYYMAPEQWSDEEPDRRCDIYSLGIILHQMLAGDVPFKGSSIPAVMKKHLMTPPPPLVSPGAGISEALERVVHHALEKDPAARTATAEDLVAELEEAVQGNGAFAKPATRRRAAAKPKATNSRSKSGAGTRVTAEQKKAQKEEKAQANRTADQAETLRKTASDESSGTLVISKGDDGLRESVESAQRSKAAVEALRLAAEAEVATRAQAARRNEQAEVEARKQAAKVEATAPAVRQPAAAEISLHDKTIVAGRVEEEDQGSLTSEEEESWRKAGEEARQRAVERALRESAASPGAPLTERVPSIRPQSQAPTRIQPPPQIREPTPRKTLSLPAGALPKYIAIAAVLLVLGGVGLFVVLRLRSSPADVTGSADAPKANLRDAVLIKGGQFTMGSDVGVTLQSPTHAATVSSFYMDKTEVTNAEYAQFVKATGHPAPTNDDADPETKGYWKPWNGSDPPAGRERWPVCNVTEKDAEDFAQWLSNRDGVRYRLPTEAEWEYAARNGSQSTPFPWGNSWVKGRANINDATSSPRDVGSFPEGATATGLLDMIGNVWEWTSTRASYYDQRPVPPDRASAFVFRGGGFADKIGPDFSNAANRGWYRNEQYKYPTIGFRLVREAR
jgi:serine/threonine protein kinase